MSQQKWPDDENTKFPVASPPTPSPVQPQPGSGSRSKKIIVICPRCGHPGNMYIDKRSYIYVYHDKDGGGRRVCYIGPAREYLHVFMASNPSQSSRLLRRRVVLDADDMYPAVEAASSPDLWSLVFQAEEGEKVICPLCGREGIKRIWKSGKKYHIFIYHPKNSRCYIAPVGGYVRRQKA